MGERKVMTRWVITASSQIAGEGFSKVLSLKSSVFSQSIS